MIYCGFMQILCIESIKTYQDLLLLLLQSFLQYFLLGYYNMLFLRSQILHRLLLHLF